MNFILLTQNSGSIIGPVAKVLGLLMNALFNALTAIGFPNIGLAIILFTIIVNIILLPLTYNQQKNMKITAVVNPEIQKITAKYKNKKDQESMEKQQKETKEIYERYGYSPTSGCLPLLIQLPILWALYRVIYAIPAYVTSIKDQYQSIVDLAIAQNGFSDKIADLATACKMSPDKYDFTGATTASKNYIIDLFYKFTDANWTTFKSTFPAIADDITPYIAKIKEMNSFLFGINLSEAPGFKLSIALLIPFLAFLTQWINIKVSSSQNNTSANSDDPTASTMKTMNIMMPLFSAYICITLPSGLGLYWIASAVVRTIFQLLLNRHFDKVGTDKIIEEAVAKQNKKREKQGIPTINKDGSYVHNSKQASNDASADAAPVKKMPKFNKITQDTSAYYEKEYEAGSIASKARLAKKFEDNKKQQ